MCIICINVSATKRITSLFLFVVLWLPLIAIYAHLDEHNNKCEISLNHDEKHITNDTFDCDFKHIKLLNSYTFEVSEFEIQIPSEFNTIENQYYNIALSIHQTYYSLRGPPQNS